MSATSFVIAAVRQQSVELAVCRAGVELIRLPAASSVNGCDVVFSAVIDVGVSVGEFNEIAVYCDGELVRKQTLNMERKHVDDKAEVRWTVSVAEAAG